jgi:hypothetical protein
MFSAASAALLLLLLLPPPLVAAAAFAATPPPPPSTVASYCTTHCGNIGIPYPFGVEPGCYRPGFDVTCSDDVGRPPRLLLRNISEVFDINLANATVDIYVRRVSESVPDNQTQSGSYLTGTWVVVGLGIEGGQFVLSSRRNKLVVVACNIQVLLMGLDDDLISTCASFCSPVAKNLYWVASPDCSGVGCCQAPIPAGVDIYQIQFRRFNGSWSGDQATVYVVDGDRLGSYAMDAMDASALPAVLEWVISDSPCPNNSTSPECRSSNSFCQNSTAFRGGHRCQCSPGFDGNPYVLDGCTGKDLVASILRLQDYSEYRFFFFHFQETKFSFNFKLPNIHFNLFPFPRR